MSKRTVQAKKLVWEQLRRYGSGESFDAQRILTAHPHLMPELGQEIRKWQVIDAARLQANSAGDGSDPGLSATSRALSPSEPPPDSFPGYQIIRRLHRGGQGVVYQALQEATGEQVAIKVMREGPFSSAHDKARFEREIQILGRLKHPNIVAIHDTGSAAGHFYYVMDYIPGQALDAYMAGVEETTEETLRLFAKICHAVNAAHLCGVIHRDLKPSNIRIDAQGKPYVLDFGLAKVASHAERVEPMTVTGQFVGSLPWAAPEQVDGSPDCIDLRTDVYALGVVLYQMLTGKFPYVVVGNIRDVMDNIANAEPIKPCTLSRAINHEVETIVLRCLQKDRERRYQSAGDLARDVERYLRGDPIEAKHDSTWYVIHKTIRRHKLPIALAVTFIVLLTGFSAAMSVMYHRAEREAVTATRVLACLEGLFKEFDPQTAANRPISVRDILDRGSERVVRELKDEPEAQARLVETIATAYGQLGMHDRAVHWWNKVVFLRRDVLGNNARKTAVGLARLAAMLHRTGRFDEAEAGYHEAIEILQRVTTGPDVDLLETLLHFGAFLQNKGDYEAALRTNTRAAELVDLVSPEDHFLVARSQQNLAGVFHDTGDYHQAEFHYLKTLEALRFVKSGQSGSTVVATEHLGLLYKDMGDYAAAEPLLRDALELARRFCGEQSVNFAHVHLSLAKLLTDAGRLDDAERVCRKAISLFQEVHGSDHLFTARPMTLLGDILVRKKHCSEAEPLLRAALEIRRKRKPPGHWKTAKTESVLGAALTGLGRFDEAEMFLPKSYSVIAADRGTAHRRSLEAAQRVVNLYDAWNKPGQAALWRAKLPADK